MSDDLPEPPEKWVCDECRKVAFEHLSAPNPFDADDTIAGCPHCKSVNTLGTACHHPDCNRPASGGYPNALGYRWAWLCHEHSFTERKMP